MPFQDVEEVSTTEYSGPPGALEAWLRKIFIEDWGLKLLALAITLLLWLAVTGVNQPVTIRTSVQLNFIRPDKMEISNDPPRTVDVLLTGRRSKLDSIKQLDLVATLDVSDLHEGERVVPARENRGGTQLNAEIHVTINGNADEATVRRGLTEALDEWMERQLTTGALQNGVAG